MTYRIMNKDGLKEARRLLSVLRKKKDPSPELIKSIEEITNSIEQAQDNNGALCERCLEWDYDAEQSTNGLTVCQECTILEGKDVI